ncbi:Protein FIZZY-RELATED 2 [Linum perenne]
MGDSTVSSSKLAAPPQSSSSSQLNLPSTMQRPSLNLETLASVPSSSSSSSEHVKRLINSKHYVSPSKTIYFDRFIPSRSASNFELFHIASSSSPSPSSSSAASNSSLSAANDGGKEESPSAYAVLLRDALFGTNTPDKRDCPARNIFRYKTETKQSMQSLSPFAFDDAGPGVSHSPVKAPRKVPRSPYKVLDAPALQDDFYLNLVDWSSNNVLAVGLGNCVYLWNACSSKVTKLCDLGIDDSVCSVGWAQRGTNNLAVGTFNGKVCGLKWSYDNRQLASGGNDNRLFVWNQHSTQPVLKYCEHTAAVKAIAWSPHLHGLLASGGGTADRCIRFWNTTTNSHLSCMDTGSQVCNLVWSKNVNELVSTHGYSQNQIIVWRYPTMSKLATLTGHTYRVLYLAISPDGQTIVTGAGDETLRFWNVFPSPKSQNTDSEIGASSFGRTTIR